MKILALLALLLGPLAHADALSDALQAGRESCGLNVQVVPATTIAAEDDFPATPQVPSGWPPVGSDVVGPNAFYSQGTRECARATAALARNPAAHTACVISSGPYLTTVYGTGIGADLPHAAFEAIRACIGTTGYTVYCLGINRVTVDVACFERG